MVGSSRYDIKASIKNLKILSGRRDSNPRHSPWQGDALPSELLPLGKELGYNIIFADENFKFFGKSLV